VTKHTKVGYLSSLFMCEPLAFLEGREMSREPGRKAGKCIKSREVILKTAACEKPTNILKQGNVS
jgi:hypothetical protein